MSTTSWYVPPAISITSPAEAALTAAWIVAYRPPFPTVRVAGPESAGHPVGRAADLVGDGDRPAPGSGTSIGCALFDDACVLGSVCGMPSVPGPPGEPTSRTESADAIPNPSNTATTRTGQSRLPHVDRRR
ncbi:hypothetical protein [Cryptosporangium sp. NPDC051539]|uniref:hypothetical protein n=1 Tax=Cryptosporangium sp. NPDC051539 TaxID=3363962 RepID=UPI0037B69712